MMGDWLTIIEPDGWTGPDWAVGTVDELVLSDASVHLESLSDTNAYLIAENTGRRVQLELVARRTTRAVRRQILARSGDALAAHLRSLIPLRWGGRTQWSTPPPGRPTAALRAWWTARHAAGAVLETTVTDDEENS